MEGGGGGEGGKTYLQLMNQITYFPVNILFKS